MPDVCAGSSPSALALTSWGCLLCHGEQRTIETQGPDYEYACAPGDFILVRCQSCGHVSLDPIPEPGRVGALYPPTYYTINPNSPLYLHGFVYESKIRRDVQRIRRFVDVHRLRSIVDIGSGDAARLFELRKFVASSTQCTALDLAFTPALVEKARSHDIGLLEGNIELDVQILRDDAHDFIIMSQILEHLRDPVATLENLRSKLTPEGFLLLETPHVGGLDYLLFRKRYWGGYHIPRHFHLFTKDSLAKTAKRVGYRVAKQGSLPSPGFWIMSCRNALGLNSRERGGSLFEFLNFSNVIVVGAFSAADLVCSAVGFSTSNQFVLLARN